MAVNTKAIKRRIKSVGNTKKITKAMEMVSAAKMRKAVDAAVKTRAYAALAWNLLVNLSKTQKVSLPLLEVRPVKNILIILITSNKGFCGSFNSNIIKKTAEQLLNPSNLAKQRIKEVNAEPSTEINVDILGIGKKGSEFIRRLDKNLIAAFTDLPDTPCLNDVLPVSQMIIDAYKEKKYDKVVVAYTDFKSAITQIAKLRQVLPISEFDLEKMITDLGKNLPAGSTKPEMELNEYLFEPDRDEILSVILPRLVETQIYQAVLESSASEQSARMMAMRNASDAAEDMLLIKPVKPVLLRKLPKLVVARRRLDNIKY